MACRTEAARRPVPDRPAAPTGSLRGHCPAYRQTPTVFICDSQLGGRAVKNHALECKATRSATGNWRGIGARPAASRVSTRLSASGQLTECCFPSLRSPTHHLLASMSTRWYRRLGGAAQKPKSVGRHARPTPTLGILALF